jgi:hypothetical protein
MTVMACLCLLPIPPLSRRPLFSQPWNLFPCFFRKQEIEFSTNITVNPDKGKIAIPAIYKQKIDKDFLGKKVNVEISC